MLHTHWGLTVVYRNDPRLGAVPYRARLLTTKADFTPRNNNSNYMRPADAILLTADLAVIPSLTKLNVQFNELGEEGEAVLRKAVEGRSGFELLL